MSVREVFSKTPLHRFQGYDSDCSTMKLVLAFLTLVVGREMTWNSRATEMMCQ